MSNAATADDVGRALAAWLAPFLVEELNRLGGEPIPESPARTAQFDNEMCATFVRTLGDKVLINGRAFFGAIAEKGQIGSLELAALIGVSSPRNIPSVLTTPLKRRAKAVGVSVPWMEGADHTDRTVWFAIDDVASRMVAAINAEDAKRRGGQG